MVRTESGCVGCGFPCMGRSCPHYEYEATFCDVCGSEIESDDVFSVDDEDMCEDCLKEKFKKVG